MRFWRRKDREPRHRPARMLAWAIVLGLLFGLVGAGEYVEDRLRVVRNHINKRPASGDIVLISIDEKSLRDVGRWPWSRGRYAELIEAIGAAGPKRQVHDIMFPEKSEPDQDARLAKALGRTPNVVLGYLPRVGVRDGSYLDVRPLPEFASRSGMASIAIYYNYAHEVWLLPQGVARDGRIIPSFASALAGKDASSGDQFRIDYSIDPRRFRR